MTTQPKPEEARNAMVEALIGYQSEYELRPFSDHVTDAMRVVPRHAFAPEAPLGEAYAIHTTLPVKEDKSGLRTSVMSTAHVQASMLDQAGIEPGMRVLEIGSGGYNAALIAELVGTAGEVTTVDIDPDVTDRARRYLDTTGYERVRVMTADAEYGADTHAPFDRIIVTVRAHDIPPAWIEQLSEDGRIVVPMQLRGVNRTIAFEQAGNHLVSRPDHHLSVFVSMQGTGAIEEHGIAVDDKVSLFGAENDVDIEALCKALNSPGIEVWSGTEFTYPDRLALWVAGHADRYALLHLPSDYLEPGPCGPVARGPVGVLLGEEGTVALRLKRPMEQSEGRFELGVRAYGPYAEQVASEYIEILHAWERHNGSMARIEIWPSDAPDEDLPTDRARTLERSRNRIVLSWP